MIGRLTGIPLSDEDGALVVDVRGVGYEVSAPLGTAGRAQRDAEGRVTIYVHTHVREDALMLFGFATESERHAFRTLIGVSNVGPKTALAVLSALPAADLARAIASKDVARLTAISGVGKKTAERLVLELRDKAAEMVATTAAAEPPPPGDEDLLVALVNLGYRRADADRALADVRRESAAAEVPELLRMALKRLARL